MTNAITPRLLGALLAAATLALVSLALVGALVFAGARADADAEADAEPPVTICDDLDAVETTVSFANDVQMVFDFNCVSCHQTGAANADLNLEFGLAYEELVEVESVQSDLLLVAPGDPHGSYLMHKLWGTQADVSGSGGIMPLGLGGLPEREIDAVATWILECALDN